MKTYQFKNTLFDYFNEKATLAFPELTDKIFRERLKVKKPDYPFIMLKSGERVRINKRFEKYQTSNGDNIRVQYSIPITFEVHALKETPSDAEKFADEIIDFVEQFFISDEQTHSELSAKGIVINELLCSGVRDCGSVTTTSQEFIREIDIVFEFEDIRTISSEAGKEVDFDIIALTDHKPHNA